MNRIITGMVGIVLMCGCAAEKPLTLDEMISRQTTTYSNADGQEAHHIMCSNPANCLLMAGTLCPRGYVKSDERVTNHTDWSANRLFGFHMDRYSITQFDIVCRWKERVP